MGTQKQRLGVLVDFGRVPIDVTLRILHLVVQKQMALVVVTIDLRDVQNAILTGIIDRAHFRKLPGWRQRRRLVLRLRHDLGAILQLLKSNPRAVIGLLLLFLRRVIHTVVLQ